MDFSFFTQRFFMKNLWKFISQMGSPLGAYESNYEVKKFKPLLLRKIWLPSDLLFLEWSYCINCFSWLGWREVVITLVWFPQTKSNLKAWSPPNIPSSWYFLNNMLATQLKVEDSGCPCPKNVEKMLVSDSDFEAKCSLSLDLETWQLVFKRIYHFGWKFFSYSQKKLYSLKMNL